MRNFKMNSEPTPRKLLLKRSESGRENYNRQKKRLQILSVIVIILFVIR